MVLGNFISLIDWLTDWLICEHDALHKKYIMFYSMWQVEINGLLIVDSYKYTWISNKVATLLLCVPVSNPGGSGLSHGE